MPTLRNPERQILKLKQLLQTYLDKPKQPLGNELFLNVRFTKLAQSLLHSHQVSTQEWCEGWINKLEQYARLKKYIVELDRLYKYLSVHLIAINLKQYPKRSLRNFLRDPALSPYSYLWITFVLKVIASGLAASDELKTDALFMEINNACIATLNGIGKFFVFSALGLAFREIIYSPLAGDMEKIFRHSSNKFQALQASLAQDAYLDPSLKVISQTLNAVNKTTRLVDVLNQLEASIKLLVLDARRIESEVDAILNNFQRVYTLLTCARSSTSNVHILLGGGADPLRKISSYLNKKDSVTQEILERRSVAKERRDALLPIEQGYEGITHLFVEDQTSNNTFSMFRNLSKNAKRHGIVATQSTFSYKSKFKAK